jgi:hypothetical protein
MRGIAGRKPAFRPKCGRCHPRRGRNAAAQAIESQAKYLEDNPETWVLTPEKFLRPDRPHGTLLSALRLFVKEPHTPQIPPENPENESARERKNRLYAHLLSLGANRTHPGTFSRWYSEYGPQHLEACMTYMAQQAERRRQAGKSKGGSSTATRAALRPISPA